MVERQIHVVVLGAGFGGLTFCQSFNHPRARVTLVDRQNHHLFQPLLYQVAMAGLSAPEIAEPIRSVLSKRRHVTVLMDTVRQVNLAERRVLCQQNSLEYDYLVIGLGGVTSYFGHPEWEEFAPGLKTLDDALRIRRDVLLAFEQAENESDVGRRKPLLTSVVIGGGPTGVELAGALAELSRRALRCDFRRIDPGAAKVILIEAGPRLLPQMPSRLSGIARARLSRLGVDVMTETRVENIRKGEVQLTGGRSIEAANILWAAGVQAHPLTRSLGVDLDRAGRIHIGPDLALPGHPNVFGVGDIVSLTDAKGRVVPGVSPAAMQMARYVARSIKRELDLPASSAAARRPFAYFDKGTMATIGRSAAVAKVGPVEFGGILAWLAWLWIHLVFLIGFDNKLTVLVQWAYSYFTYKRGARIITGLDRGQNASTNFTSARTS